jgi:tRNA(Ile)-lysidine synthase
LETILMRLIRGSGPAGLGAITPRRVIDRGEPSAVHLVRPMLVATREDSERICRSAQWAWREDVTNRDASRLRSAIRQFVAPALKRVSPGCERRADDAARSCRQAAALVRRDAERLVASATTSALDRSGRVSSMPDDSSVDPPARRAVSVTLDRESLRASRAIVAIEAIRLTAIRITGGDTLDAISARMLRSAAKTVRGDVGGVRRIEWKALSIEITRDHVTMSRSDETPP